MSSKLSINYQISSLTIIIIGIYYPIIFSPFNTIDDLKMIDGLLNLEEFSVKQILIPNSYGQYYRPLLYLSFIADKYFWGLDSGFMHLENIFLHVVNSILVFWLVSQLLSLLSIKSQFAPFVTALLFGLHPIATEPVNWISGRTDLMSGFFVLLSFGLLLKVTSASNKINLCVVEFKQVNCWCNHNYYIYTFSLCSAVSLFAGCLSKETALFVLPVFLTWCIFPPSRISSVDGKSIYAMSLGQRLFLLSIFSFAGTIYLLLRWMALSGGDKIVKTTATVVMSSGKAGSTEVIDVVRVSLKTAGFYFKKLIVPVPLNFGITNISPHYWLLGLLVFCGVAWCFYRLDTISYLFIAAFMLSSSAFILPILKITWTPIAERYVYMASAPFLMGVTILYIKYLSSLISIRLTTLVVAGILGIAAVITVQRNYIWQDNYTLFEDTVKKSPDFGAIKNEYAIALISRGRSADANKIMLSNVVDEFQPSSLNRIRVMMNYGKLTEARSMLVERLKKPSEYEIASRELLLKIDEVRREEAKQVIEKQRIDQDILDDLGKLATITGDPFYSYRLGTVQLRLGDKNSAKASFTNAYQKSPKSSHYKDAAKKLADKL